MLLQTTLVELLQALRVDTRLALAVACRCGLNRVDVYICCV